MQHAEKAPLVVPVRFVTTRFAVQTTTRELGPRGLTVRCKAPPRRGERLSLALYLPEARLPEVAIATVVASDSLRAAFWADFVAIDAEACHRIATLVERRLRPIARYDVGFPDARAFVEEHARHLEQGMLFIPTEAPAPVAAVVEARIRLPDGGLPATVSALVIDRIASAGGPAGLLARLVSYTDGLQARIDCYLARLAAAPRRATV